MPKIQKHLNIYQEFYKQFHEMSKLEKSIKLHFFLNTEKNLIKSVESFIILMSEFKVLIQL